MANSLREKLSKLRHDGHITDAEYKDFIKKLDGHDREIRNKAIDEFVGRLEKHTQENWIDHQEYGITWADIEQVAEQLKGVRNEN